MCQSRLKLHLSQGNEHKENVQTLLYDLHASGHKKTAIFTLLLIFQAIPGSGFALVEQIQHNCDKSCGTVAPFSSNTGQGRCRPFLKWSAYFWSETPNKFKHKFNKQTTTLGYFIPPPLLHRGFRSCLVPLVGYCSTLIGVSWFFSGDYKSSLQLRGAAVT